MVKPTWSNFINIFSKYVKFYFYICLSLDCTFQSLRYILYSGASLFYAVYTVWLYYIFFMMLENWLCLKYPYNYSAIFI